MTALIRQIAGLQFLRYLVASALSLVVDFGWFLFFLQHGMSPMLAGAAGYALGIGVHWMLSSRAVFVDEVADNRAERARQKALFIGSALLGLAVTSQVVAIGTALGGDPRLAKLVAVAASFSLTWLLRRKVVFA